jgi:hypothetical protein
MEGTIYCLMLGTIPGFAWRNRGTMSISTKEADVWLRFILFISQIRVRNATA